ncbi:IclR family transcriptional regulator [Leifsonia kafniensis]|uniref:IclR family transcriptional regulator n=1 Tax=Leifsonia kafniensis TaxID=475957 RepID=A0ABP7KQ00_9MICO
MVGVTVETAQTADYALRVLLELEAHDGQTMSELADKIDVGRSVVHRIIATLRVHAAVTRDPRGRYWLGPMLVLLARGLQHELATVGDGALAELAELCQETAIISVPEGDQSVVVACALGHTGALRVEHEVGFRQPLSRGASSLAILAYQRHPAISRLLQPEDLGVLEEIRAQGYAQTTGQIRSHMVALAAPILDEDGWAIGSVALIAPETRAELLESSKASLLSTARVIADGYAQRKNAQPEGRSSK